MDTTAYIKSHTAVLSSVNPASVRLSNPSSVPSRTPTSPTRLPEGLCRGARADRQQPVAFFDRELEHELRSFPILASLCSYMDVGFVFSSGWSPARSPTKRRKSSEVEAKASSSTGNYCWGEPVTRTHVPTGKNKRVVKKGVEVEIPAIRFMLEFRTPASASG
jgi:hypothetical protein